jgi:hypothetical protein
VQRNVTARRVSFGEADDKLTALIPGSGPDLLLIKQVDQVSALNGRLPPAGGRQDLHRIDELGRRVELRDVLPEEIKLD